MMRKSYQTDTDTIPENLVIADFNSDQHMDIAFVGSYGKRVGILFGDMEEETLSISSRFPSTMKFGLISFSLLISTITIKQIWYSLRIRPKKSSCSWTSINHHGVKSSPINFGLRLAWSQCLLLIWAIITIRIWSSSSRGMSQYESFSISETKPLPHLSSSHLARNSNIRLCALVTSTTIRMLI